ncbi:hypothetical protein D3C73_944340 [compost metagenome]
MAGRRAVTDDYADIRIAPLFNHKPAPEFTADRIFLVPADTQNTCNGNMVFGPGGWLIRRITGCIRHAPIVLLHQCQVGGWQLIAKLIFN